MPIMVMFGSIHPGDLQKPEAYTSGPHDNFDGDIVVICGFGPAGQTIADFLSGTRTSDDQYMKPTNYVGFDLDPDVVTKAYKSGKRVLYGDGSQPKVLTTAGIENPHAFVVTYAEPELATQAVERLRLAYPSVPILSRLVGL